MKTIVIDDYLDKDVYDMMYKMYQNTKAGSDVKRTMFDYDPTPQIADLINEFNNKREYDKLAKFIHTAATPPNYHHKVHDEAEFKIMSAIVYIGPEKAPGTTFYIDGKEDTIEWKPNRLMVFCGETNVTWHDYKSDDHMRFTYNYFLIDPTKVENETYKNYIIRL